MNQSKLVLIVAVCMISLLTGHVIAQSTAQKSGEEPDVASKQSSLAEDYQLLEKKLFQLYEYESTTNPDRSRLLKQAFEQSQAELTFEQLQAVAKSLSAKDWKTAIAGQESALEDLTSLLELLESEDRGKRIRDRQEQIQRYIDEVDRLMRLQRGIRGQTEGGVDGKRLEKSQGQAAERAARLGKQIDDDRGTENNKPSFRNTERPDSDPNADEEEPKDGQPKDGQPEDGQPEDGQPEDGQPEDGQPEDGQPEDGQPKDGQPKDGQSKDGDPKDGQPKDGDPKDGQPKDGESKDGESKDGESKDGEPQVGQPQDGDPKDGQPKDGQPQDGQPQDGQPQDGQPQDSQPQDSQPQSAKPSPQQQQPASPEGRVRKRIQAAEDRMRQAQKKLDEAERDDSADQMQKAEEELAQAKKELEEILRQLREEEVERSLAMLEGRFRRMLEQQVRILEKTKLNNKTPSENRDSEFEIRIGKLSVEQRNIGADADRALLVLREDGSSIAFPETVSQMRDDMFQVAARLDAGKVNEMTQEIEQDIIDTLNDLIEALIKAQKDQEEQDDSQSPPPSGQPQGQPGEQPLVDQIAELKMIRGLQLRINKRHKRYAENLDDPSDPIGFSDDPEIKTALKRLSDRQDKVQQITRDIVLGKNK